MTDRLRPAPMGVKQRLLPLLLVCAFWAGCLAEVALVPVVQGMAPPRYGGLATGVTATTAFLLLSVLFARGSLPRLGTLGILPDRFSAARMFAGCLLGTLLLGIYFAVSAGIADVGWSRNSAVGPAAVALGFVAAIAGAAAEELAFRGYPMRRLMEAYGLWAAQLVIAVAFILYHIVLAGWPVVPAIIGTGLGSLLFGMAAVVSRGLALPIGLHAVWNFGMWAGGTRELPAPWEIARIDQASAELANWTAFPVAAGVGIGLLVTLYYRGRRRARPGL
jgi:membrane protease YdiL (CAAX protease family)